MEITDVITEFEKQINPDKPEGGPFGCRILDYGEVSAVLTLDALPGRALKRMSGFASEHETRDYVDALDEYQKLLSQRGISVIDTECHAIHGSTNTVYLIQPFVEKEKIGNTILRNASEDVMARSIEQVLDCVANCLRANKSVSGGIEVAADSQMSNWYFPDSRTTPLLIDVGSPIKRVNGKVSAFTEPIYRTLPWPIRPVVRLMRMVEDYFNDYFDLRLAILDLIGNFYKEQVAHRIPEGIGIINNWLAHQPEKEAVGLITEKDVKKYYGIDAFLLELLLQVRRMTRFVKSGIFGKRYDYILPGKIKRR